MHENFVAARRGRVTRGDRGISSGLIKLSFEINFQQNFLQSNCHIGSISSALVYGVPANFSHFIRVRCIEDSETSHDAARYSVETEENSVSNSLKSHYIIITPTINESRPQVPKNNFQLHSAFGGRCSVGRGKLKSTSQCK